MSNIEEEYRILMNELREYRADLLEKTPAGGRLPDGPQTRVLNWKSSLIFPMIISLCQLPPPIT